MNSCLIVKCIVKINLVFIRSRINEVNREFYLIESALNKDNIPSAQINVEKVIVFDRAIMVHKILGEMCLESLKGKFTKRSQASKYETRGMNDLQIPKQRLEIS